jgi:hypothetical protein
MSAIDPHSLTRKVLLCGLKGCECEAIAVRSHPANPMLPLCREHLRKGHRVRYGANELKPLPVYRTELVYDSSTPSH